MAAALPTYQRVNTKTHKI